MESDNDIARKTEARNTLAVREAEIRALLEEVAPINAKIDQIERVIEAKIRQLRTQEIQTTGLQELREKSNTIARNLLDSARKIIDSNSELSRWCRCPDWAIKKEGYYGTCLLCGKVYDVD